MALCCVMCKNETLFISSLCSKCSIISKYMQIYSPEIIHDILHKTLVVKNIEKRLNKQIEEVTKTN